jgi:hypothetical protein
LPLPRFALEPASLRPVSKWPHSPRAPPRRDALAG